MIKKISVSPLGNSGGVASGLTRQYRPEPNKEKIKTANTHQLLHD